jgi:hypothetical protein
MEERGPGSEWHQAAEFKDTGGIGYHRGQKLSVQKEVNRFGILEASAVNPYLTPLLDPGLQRVRDNQPSVRRL